MSDQDNAPETQAPQTPEPNQEQIDLEALARKIAEIKTGDGRQKYESVEKAVESIPHKEEFIEQLKAEVSEERLKREELEKRFGEMETKVSIEERIAEKIASQKGPEERPSSVDIDEQKLSELVANIVDSKDTQKKRQLNASKFVDAVASETKDVAAFIEAKAELIGIGVSTFEDLIAQSPDAALKLVGLNSTAPVKTQPNVNTTGFQARQESVPPVPKLFSNTSQRTARAEQIRKEIEAKLNKGN